MAKTGRKFTLKFILGYVALALLAAAISYFVYLEFQQSLRVSDDETEEQKFIETGSLINLLYESESFSRLALLTMEDEDFETYERKRDSLYKKINTIQKLANDSTHTKQLDSIKKLLDEKKRNIEQLRILKLTNKEDTSLDDILKEFRKFETSMGRLTLDNFVNNPDRLSERERQVLSSYADYLNNTVNVDSTSVDTETVDSMLSAARIIVAEAKIRNTQASKELRAKENQLILNDLTISASLQQIISAFDAEIKHDAENAAAVREASIDRTRDVLRYGAIAGMLVIFLFSYMVLNDFFKAERFKKSLQKEKHYSEALVKSREQLISTVSHDLKTPLNTISGYSELLQSTHLSGKQKDYIKNISNSSLYVNKLVEDLLDFSKLEAGKLTIEKMSFSLCNLIEETAETTQQLYTKKPVDLIVDCKDPVETTIYKSDPFRIKQIITNLIGNAYKFTEKGKIVVRAKEVSVSNNIASLQISIADTGIGISEEKLDYIFREFAQAESDTEVKYGGYGLGLAISRKIAELLGGTLTVESKQGEGSTFFLTLPMEISKRNSNEKLDTNISKTAEETQHAIVFDDDPAMASMLKEMFLQMNITCHTFASYSEFESSEIPQKTDFVITDIQMPDVDGFSVAENLKDISTFNEVPIIAMTGSRKYTSDHYLEKGFAAVLQKPFTKIELQETLNTVLHTAFKVKPVKKIVPSTAPLEEDFSLSSIRTFLANEEALQEVLNTFIQQSKGDLQRIKWANNDKDYLRIEQIAHRMLTMSRQLNAQKVVKILEKLDDCYEAEYSENEIDVLVKNLCVELNNLMDLIENQTSKL